MENTLHLKPENVFHYFEEICKIPHGSGNTKAISDYIVAFAKERNLEYYQDELNNVIMIKEASKGYESAEPIIIQGHMDMVCEKEDDASIDFEKDGLTLYVEGDFLKAKGTTLGGDDGIAVAFAMALLEDDSLEHPRLEIIITVDEETGMYGVQGIDLAPIKGHIMLNVDSDEEGVFLTSSAGGLITTIDLPVKRIEEEGVLCLLKVQGLYGGHSGAEIDQERASANKIMGRILKAISDQYEFSMISLEGGQKDNAITRASFSELLIRKKDLDSIRNLIKEEESVLKKEYAVTDSGVEIILEDKGWEKKQVLDVTSQTKIIFLLREMPFGVQYMSKEMKGLVETSVNPGIMNLEEDKLHLLFSVRSSVTTRKYEVADRISFLGEFIGAEVTIDGDYPAWEYRQESEVRGKITEVYRELFQEEPKIQAIHAGLECGYFADKIPNLDAVSFGPKNLDIHTPQERLSISSTEKYWKLLVEYLRRAH